MAGSLWPRLAGLPLVVEACEYERLHAVLAHEFERITTHVRLVGAGAGADGLGEDVSVLREDGTALHETRPSLPLEGEWTLAGFCDKLATLELWPEPPGSVGSSGGRRTAQGNAASSSDSGWGVGAPCPPPAVSEVRARARHR